MIESFVITLREGVEVALIVGIVLSYVRKVGKEGLSFSVYVGLAAGIVLSVLLAFTFTQVKVNQEAFEGVVMLLAAFFVGSMVLWMWKTSRYIKQDIERQAGHVLSSSSGKWSFGLFAFVTLCVLREGVETVAFLSAVSLTSSELLGFVGGIAGLFASFIFGYLLVQGSIAVNLPRFFKVTGAVLLIFAFQLIVSGLHEFGEVGIIPVSKREMAFIGPIVKNNLFFLLAILSLPIFILLFPGNKKGTEELSGLSAPERRKILAKKKRDAFFRMASSSAGFLVITALSLRMVYGRTPKDITPPKMVKAKEGFIRIPLSEVSDGALHRYGYSVKGTTVRFLAMKVPAGAVKTAFDACRICGSRGYVQEGKGIVCLNCAADINTVSLGEAGGCNPIPLPSRLEKGELSIEVKNLFPEMKFFGKKAVPEVVCPVCGMSFRLDHAGGELQYRGKTHYFCRMPTCQKEFRKNPGKYVK